MKILSLFTLLFVLNTLYAQPRVLIDDDFSDWQNTAPAYTDTEGDNGFSIIDFEKLWIANDDNYLFLNIEVGSEINLQEFNEIGLYIDTDNDSSTGIDVNGIGADLFYSFGNRSGIVYVGNNNSPIFHDDIQLITAPTVSSAQFEMAISRDLVFFGEALFQGSTIKVIFKDDSGPWDVLPDATGGVEYVFTNETYDPLPEYSIQKTNAELLRVLSYNVLTNGLFDFGRAPAMARLIEAIAPEIMGFQEIYDFSASDVAAKIETILPPGTNEQWYHAKEGPDIITVSKYPILSTYPIDNNGAFLLDLEADFGTKLLFVVAHTPCCGNNTERQMEIDAIMAFIRDAKAGIGALQLEENTPIIIVGDMNMVGYQQQLATFLTGNIINEDNYGADFNPDWDGSEMEDSRPYTTGLPMNITWFNEGSSFSPGRLDFIFYTGSVLELSNSFTLFTRNLPQDSLSTYGLLQEDAIIASDHLPVVTDFFLNNTTSAENIAGNTNNETLFLQNEPNPFEQTTTIKYQLPKRSFVTLSIYNSLGKKVADLVNERQNVGRYSIDFKANGLNSGIYFLKIKAGNIKETKKLMLLK